MQQISRRHRHEKRRQFTWPNRSARNETGRASVLSLTSTKSLSMSVAKAEIADAANR